MQAHTHKHRHTPCWPEMQNHRRTVPQAATCSSSGVDRRCATMAQEQTVLCPNIRRRSRQSLHSRGLAVHGTRAVLPNGARPADHTGGSQRCDAMSHKHDGAHAAAFQQRRQQGSGQRLAVAAWHACEMGMVHQPPVVRPTSPASVALAGVHDHNNKARMG